MLHAEGQHGLVCSGSPNMSTHKMSTRATCSVQEAAPAHATEQRRSTRNSHTQRAQPVQQETPKAAGPVTHPLTV